MASGTITQKQTISGSITQKTAVSVNGLTVGSDHSKLYNRDLTNQHPISAITGLSDKLLNMMHFAGAIEGTVLPDASLYQYGDIIVMSGLKKEFILNIDNNIKQWLELGDEAHYASNDIVIEGIDGLTGEGDLSSNIIQISHAIPEGASTNITWAYKIATDKFGHVTAAEPFVYGTADKNNTPTTVSDGSFSGGTSSNKSFEVSYDEESASLILTTLTPVTKQIYEAVDAPASRAEVTSEN